MVDKQHRIGTARIVSEENRVSHPIYNLLPTESEGFDSLAELALDMRWSWNHATDEVRRKLDPKLWAITENPWVVLQTASRDQIERVLADPIFRKHIDGLVEASRQAAKAPAWFQKSARPDNRSGFSAPLHRRRLARLGGGDPSWSTLCLPRGWPL
jgi:uncharacterized protein DUF3417